MAVHIFDCEHWLNNHDTSQCLEQDWVEQGMPDTTIYFDDIPPINDELLFEINFELFLIFGDEEFLDISQQYLQIKTQ